jgi:5'-phosphate synthase pdxT subunit
VFIRAPWIDKVGGSVEVLATVADPETGRDRPVVVRQDNIVATSFHPELTADGRLHELFLGKD